jgi:hypothetical protein
MKGEGLCKLATALVLSCTGLLLGSIIFEQDGSIGGECGDLLLFLEVEGLCSQLHISGFMVVWRISQIEGLLGQGNTNLPKNFS